MKLDYPHIIKEGPVRYELVNLTVITLSMILIKSLPT